MKKILLIMTGGTICSFRDSTGHNAADVGKAAPLLIDVLRESESPMKDVEFEIISPLDTLSENMSVEKWNILLDAIRKVRLSDYSGIIITHGTDTLHMTSPLIAEVMEGSLIPVGLVAAQKPLWDEDSNGGENFIRTVEYIAEINRNPDGYAASERTFVIYRNSDGICKLHKASELERCGNFSEDFYSRNMKNLQKILEENSQADRMIPEETVTDISDRREPKLYHMSALKSTVMMIDPYVGIDYDTFDISRVKHILQLTYHSGTADSEKLPAFIKKCTAAGVDFYLAPVPRDYRYCSTFGLISAGAKPISDITPWAAYAKLLVEDAVDLPQEHTLG